MAKGTGSAARSQKVDRGPVSVVLPPELRARVQAEARKRGLKLSPAVRALLIERVKELDDAAQLSRAEEWQRAEAWATWERMKAGDRREVSKAEIDAEIDGALQRAHAARSR
jgi:hypothetical protein